MTGASEQPSPEPVVAMMQGLQVSGILQAGIELRVFDAIAAGATDVRAIAASAGSSQRGTRILLDALAALELLERRDGSYALSTLAEEYLVSGRTGYLGG
jgi:MoxR-like ATPase